MHRKALRDAVEIYEELLRLHQLNEELLRALELSMLWLLDFSKKHNSPIPDREKFVPLLRKVHVLIDEISSPPLLRHQKRTDDFLQQDESDDKFTESP